MSPQAEPDGATTVDIEMGDDWPAHDRLAMERARARTQHALFGHAEPARIGRYELLEPIAGGGMGVVYAAYDPELDRRVALKVLNPRRSQDEQSHSRLIKEARALARLDHPNVVKVHDVVSHDGQVVIIMELVAGDTLATWEAAAPRTRRDILAAYVQAGDGLVAAHGVDVIHRDFKPSNAVIGTDGRVRVLDFGLAQLATEAEPAEGPADCAHRTTIAQTATGVVMGTPAYASPEQLAGRPVTAATDQFSFCVALHRAIEGIDPFPGATVVERAASIETAAPALAKDGRSVPAWLRAAIRRGLAPDPAQRHPSMRALLAELRRPRGWKRWRWPTLAALLVCMTVVATMTVRGGAAERECDGGAADVASVWGPQQRATLETTLERIGTPYAHEVATRVLAELDAHVTQWSSVHRAACVAHREGTQSDALLDRTMVCLRQRLDDVTAAVAVLGRTDTERVTQAVDVVAGMPQVSMCADPARLLSDVDPPATPVLRAQVAAVRAHLSTAAALERAGRSEESLAAILAASGEAASTGYQPVIAEVTLEYGRILLAHGNPINAAPVLRDAMKTALAYNLASLAVEAAARRIYAEGMQSGDPEKLVRDLEYLEPMSRALVGDRFARPLLLNNVGAVYMAARHDRDALRYFQLAHEAVARDGGRDLELAFIDQNIAMLTTDAGTRVKLCQDVSLRLEATLGEHHLSTLQARMTHAMFSPDAATAYPLTVQICADYRRMHPDLVELYVDCESVRGFLAAELGQRNAADAAYSAVIDAIDAADSSYQNSHPDLIITRHLAAGELALLRADVPTAVQELGAVVDANGHSENWWDLKLAWQAELGLGLAASDTGDRATAFRHLDTAVTGFAQITRSNQQLVYRLRLEKALWVRAAISFGSPERNSSSPH